MSTRDTFINYQLSASIPLKTYIVTAKFLYSYSTIRISLQTFSAIVKITALLFKFV